MNLRELAEADNEFLIEDDTAGFAVPATFTNSDGKKYVAKCIFNRVGVDIDPETGLLVAGSKSTISVRLIRLGGEIPDEGWTVETTDITGAAIKARCKYVMPDRTAGRATIILGR